MKFSSISRAFPASEETLHHSEVEVGELNKENDKSCFQHAGHRPEGRHVLLDLSGCDYQLLNSVDEVREILLNSAADGGATVISSHFHPFKPQGLSGVVVIAESHITIHTWPEHGYASVDVFTCGDGEIADAVASFIVSRFHASKVHKVTLLRGVESKIASPSIKT